MIALSHQEIQYIPAFRVLRFIQFRVSAIRTTDRDKFFILNIKDLSKISPGGLELVTLIMLAPTLRAYILHFLHITILLTYNAYSNKQSNITPLSYQIIPKK